MSETEIIKEDKIEQDSIFLRTVIKKSVYERVKALAQKYSTGRGNWDFGVAIEILLDWYESSQLSSINDKIDLLFNALADKEQESQEDEEVYEEFLGGTKEKVSK